MKTEDDLLAWEYNLKKIRIVKEIEQTDYAKKLCYTEWLKIS